MKIYIEQNEELNTTISEAIDYIIKSAPECMGKLPKNKKRKIVARALVSNLVIEELHGQIEFLITGNIPE